MAEAERDVDPEKYGADEPLAELLLRDDADASFSKPLQPTVIINRDRLVLVLAAEDKAPTYFVKSIGWFSHLTLSRLREIRDSPEG